MKLKKALMTIIFGALAVFAAPGGAAKAASASVAIESERENYYTDDLVKVSLIIRADEFIGDFVGYLSYSETILEYVSGPDLIAGDNGLLKITDMEPDAASDSRKYVMIFRAAGTGTARINLLSGPEIYALETGNMMSASAGELYIRIDPAADASDETSLLSLRISPGKLTPEFNPEVLLYETEVSSDTESLIVSAEPASENAEIKISGEKDLYPGKNRVIITVSAENGDEAEYIIIVNKSGPVGNVSAENGGNNETTAGADNSEKESEGFSGEDAADGNNPDAGTADGSLSEEKGSEGGGSGKDFTLSARKDDDGTHIFGGFDYKVCTLPDDVLVPEGYSKTKIIINGISVPAFAETGKTGNFVLLYLQREGSEPAFYSYDRVEKTVQRFAERSEIRLVRSDGMIKSGDLTLEKLEEYESNQKRTSVLVGVFCALSAVMLLFAIKLFLTGRK